jgi:hypothetical protein
MPDTSRRHPCLYGCDHLARWRHAACCSWCVAHHYGRRPGPRVHTRTCEASHRGPNDACDRSKG